MDDRFRGLDFMPTQTVILNPDGRILYVNEAWIEFARSNGYRGDDFVGLNYLGACEAARGAEKQQADYFAENLRSVLEGTLRTFELVYPCHGPDAKRWFKGIAKNHGGQTVVTHIDISIELEHFQRVSRFYENARILHDLRSPLTAILGFSEIAGTLPADEQNWAKVLKYFDLIQAAGSRMLEVVDEILNFSRDIDVSENPSETVVSLGLLGREIQKMLLPLYEREGMCFDLDIPDDIVLRGDGQKLWKILTNLASNAIKYNRPNGSVALSASLNGSGGIEVTVKDTGVGMAPEAVKTIFEPFTRLYDCRATSSREGTGLGLAIVRDLVHEHEGNILVRSAVDAGTDITIQFPAWRTAGG